MAIRVIRSYNTITGEKTPNLENMIPFQLGRSANAKLFSICNWQNRHELRRIRVAISRTDSRAKRLHYEADFQTHVPTFRGSNLGFLKTKAGLRHQKPDVQDHPYVTAASTRTCKELVQKTRRSARIVLLVQHVIADCPMFAMQRNILRDSHLESWEWLDDSYRTSTVQTQKSVDYMLT